MLDLQHSILKSTLHSFVRRQSLSSTKLLSSHSAGDGEEDKPEAQLAMVNREIVRRGALILFCDYVVRGLRGLDHRKLLNTSGIDQKYTVEIKILII